VGGVAPQFVFPAARLFGLGLQITRAQVALKSVRASDGNRAQTVKQPLPVQTEFLSDLGIQQPRIGLLVQGTRLGVVRGGRN